MVVSINGSCLLLVVGCRVLTIDFRVLLVVVVGSWLSGVVVGFCCRVLLVDFLCRGCHLVLPMSVPSSVHIHYLNLIRTQIQHIGCRDE
jgi:hypothetical protein